MGQLNHKAAIPVGYIELVRHNRNYRYLWLGQVVSLLGDWFTLIAAASLISSLTQSGLAVSTLFIVRMLTPFLVSPIAGVVADRYNRKHILIMTDIGRAVLMIGFLFVRDADDIWLLYTLTALQFAITGFFFPTRNAILPDIVSDRELGAANALSAATWSTMLALGAAIGGIVSGTLGIYAAFGIDAVTFLVSALILAQMTLDVRPGLETSDKTIGAALQQYLDGLRYLGRNRNILVIACHKAAIALMAGSTYEIIQVAIAERIFIIGVGGGIGLGLMFGINGVGSGIGPLVARYFTHDKPRTLSITMILGYIMIAVGYIISAPLFSFGAILLGTFLRGVGGGVVWVFSTQLLMQLVPGHIRGRVFASEFALFTLMGAVGAAIVGGALDTNLGISAIIWWMSALILIPAVLWSIWLASGRLAGQDADPARVG